MGARGLDPQTRVGSRLLPGPRAVENCFANWDGNANQALLSSPRVLSLHPPLPFPAEQRAVFKC